MQRPDSTSASHSEGADKESSEVCKLLSIELQELQVSHEMKRLFGRAAFHDDGDAPPPQARVPNGQTASLSDAVSGKYAQGGPGLSAMLRRRNIFVQGKEEWPRATGGGLGMEVVEKRAGGIVEYRFVHNPAYQHCQHEFQACVQAMDPSMMVNMLRFNRMYSDLKRSCFTNQRHSLPRLHPASSFRDCQARKRSCNVRGAPRTSFVRVRKVPPFYIRSKPGAR